MKYKHKECIFDICNFNGHNGGAWADLWEGGIITFGGAWHGDWIDDEQSGYLWLPGGKCPLYDTDDREKYTFRSSELCGGGINIMSSSVYFGVRGNIKPLLKRFASDRCPKPSDFKDVVILAPSELDELLEER